MCCTIKMLCVFFCEAAGHLMWCFVMSALRAIECNPQIPDDLTIDDGEKPEQQGADVDAGGKV